MSEARLPAFGCAIFLADVCPAKVRRVDAEGPLSGRHGWVLVDYDRHFIPPRERYDLSGYEPLYDQLPTRPITRQPITKARKLTYNAGVATATTRCRRLQKPWARRCLPLRCGNR